MAPGDEHEPFRHHVGNQDIPDGMVGGPEHNAWPTPPWSTWRSSVGQLELDRLHNLQLEALRPRRP